MWRNASNWGFLSGIGLFAVNLIGWGLKLEAGAPLIYELLLFVALCALIVVSGKLNAKNAGEAGYGYGVAVGFVLTMMACAGCAHDDGMCGYRLRGREVFADQFFRAGVLRDIERKGSGCGFVVV